MIPLPTQFTRFRFVHRQAKRAGSIALFERWHVSSPDRVHFEVVRVQAIQAREIFGHASPAHEAYPPSESWGTHGFTYTPDDRLGAERKFANLSA